VGCNPSSPDGQKASDTKAAAAPAAQQGQQPPAEAAPKTEAKIRIFVSNYQGDNLSVIEGALGDEKETVPVEESPHGLAIRPTEPRLLAVARSTGGGVTFIDPDTLENKGDVDTSTGPQDLEFSPDGKQLYVVSPLAGDLNFIDVDAMKLDGNKIQFEKKARRILVDASGKRLFVLLIAPPDQGGSEVAVIDPKQRTIEKRIPVGVHPQAMALGNNGLTLATASFDDSTLSVIDTRTLDVWATYPARTGMGLAIHPTKPIAYSMESFDDTIQILNLDTGAEIKTLSPAQWPTYCDFGPDGRYLYVAHEESDSLVAIDTETNEVAAKIAVGKGPLEVAVYQR
jgi:YVTN family beta-propeller protein